MEDHSLEQLIDIRTFLIETSSAHARLDAHSSTEVITTTMCHECDRLKAFMGSCISAAEDVLRTGLLPKLPIESFYYPPPHPRSQARIRPPDDYYRRFVPKKFLAHESFQLDAVVPKSTHSGAIEIGGAFHSGYFTGRPPEVELWFAVNYHDTVTAFGWLLKEWRRLIGQLLRGLPNLELWGNGNGLDTRPTDPATRLEHYLAAGDTDSSTPNLFSLRSAFSSTSPLQDIQLTVAVFLCLFDCVYRLTSKRADPDCLLSHYQSLSLLLPKAAFRASTIFAKE